jgi:glycosyltransferase involved in cell wall biosynthesis
MTLLLDRLKSQVLIGSMETSFSILVCTYQPQEQIFRRTLRSIELLNMPGGIPVECVVVDNNSPIPIDQLSYVREFLERCPWAKVIRETRQGLTFARIAGFQAAQNSIIVFVDDDNEISSSYIVETTNLFLKYPTVAAWGPGNIDVEFMGNVSNWFSNEFKYLFQEKHVKYNEYGCLPETWASFYPIGTGLAVGREILDKYCVEVENANLLSSDRKGKSLSSGGDIQIVWEAIKMGYAAGVSPALSVRHLIPSSRSNLDYVKRLCFGTASSYLPCLASSFPEVKSSIELSIPSTVSILNVLLKKTVKYSIKFKFSLLLIDLAGYLGSVSGQYQLTQKNNSIVEFMIKRLKLQ